jgi:preprotein translocase subunit SecG
MLQQLVWFLHMFCALFIIILVLLQHGKGAELGASFSSGASQTIFGSQGTGSFLTKLTTVFALIFAITSISLSFFINQKRQSKTISEIIKQEQQQHQGQGSSEEDIPE